MKLGVLAIQMPMTIVYYITIPSQQKQTTKYVYQKINKICTGYYN